MIESIRMQDVTLFDEFEWDELANVNLVIGENDTGKSNLLKMLYAVTRSLEKTNRSNSSIGGEVQLPVVLAEKLQWTYLPRNLNLGEIVRKGGGRLRVACQYDGEAQIEFGFSRSATKEIRDVYAEGRSNFNDESEAVDSLFIPPEEILSTRNSIVGIRDRLGYGEIDDPHYDLARALMAPESHTDRDPSIQAVFEKLDAMFPGRFEQVEGGKMLYRRGNEKYSVAQAAQGIRKIGMLTQLLRSRYIRKGSVLFFDEPSTSLNPESILTLVELLFELAQAGVQVVVATHSYVVLKQFELLAREHEQRTPLCVLSKEDDTVESRFADLSDHIPRNSIVDASVELYERDVNLSLRR